MEIVVFDEVVRCHVIHFATVSIFHHVGGVVIMSKWAGLNRSACMREMLQFNHSSSPVMSTTMNG